MEQKINWENIDWTCNNSHLARQLDVSRERVRQMRKKLGAQKSLFYYKHMDAPVHKLLDLSDDVWAAKTNRDLANMFGYRESTIDYIGTLREKYNKPKPLIKKVVLKRYKIDWDRVDWNVAPKDIAKKMGVSILSVYKNRKRLLVK